MSFNLNGSSNTYTNSFILLRADTIQGYTNPNLLNINSNSNINGQLDVNGPIYISGITNVTSTLIFSNTAGNLIEMAGNGTIYNLNTIVPTLTNPLNIDNNNNSTQIKLQHTISPGLGISTIDNLINWIGLQAGNYVDNTSVVLGVYNGNVVIGAHNANRTAWTNLYIQSGGKLNVGLASNTEQFNVVNNIRTDSGTFYKNNIDMFQYKRFSPFGGSQIEISNTTYVKIFEFIYLGSNFIGTINNIYLSANPNGNTLSFKVSDDVNSVTVCENTSVSGPGYNGIYSFSSISTSFTYWMKPLSLYAKVNSGTGYWNSGYVYYEWFNP